MTKKRISGRQILKLIYDHGLEAVDLFVQRYGRLQNEHLIRAFTPPDSDLWVERAAWGELATKYVFWAQYMHNNQYLKTAIEMQHALYDLFCFIDQKDQAEKAWEITGRQVLYEELETTRVKHQRFTCELADIMEQYTRLTQKVNDFFYIKKAVCTTAQKRLHRK